MGIPLLRGRNFGPLDRRGSPVVAIVSQSFVRRFFPDADPIGQRVSGVRIPEMQNMPIVGVVGDTRRGGMLEGFTPELYVSYAQFPQPGATVIVRAPVRGSASSHERGHRAHRSDRSGHRD